MGFEDYPISDYYKPHIIDAQTINENERWWTAVVKIKMPNAAKPMVIVYLWQKRGEDWKVSSKFKLRPKLSRQGGRDPTDDRNYKEIFERNGKEQEESALQ